ncbi:hypothetical protein [Lyngbya sp. CCY1209]|uniref:hypothetical protein n=1 Tax=Lyngbya sp. CCY1209 TaxID=2886103 RepID=UPI002D210A78|nr:hypothetical protein [Lyngbya sp. CCY1209]MEB3882259.1 hypothetical protein [Lyngbya sp. CCY1209]
MEPLKHEALSFLKTALDDPAATFRDGQWEAIARLIDRRERLLVVQPRYQIAPDSAGVD